MFIPYKIETLDEKLPLANILIMVLCIGFFISQAVGSDFTKEMILKSWSPLQLVGHMFLHGSPVHLIGNMIVLMVFGNAICSNSNNAVYLLLYLSFGLIAGAALLTFDSRIGLVGALGASGAICGIMGMAAVMYPINKVHCFYYFYMKTGTVEIQAWILIVVWFIFDVEGAMRGVGNVGYLAHIAGTLTGAVSGYIILETKLIRLTPYDNRSLPEILKGKYIEDREYE